MKYTFTRKQIVNAFNNKILDDDNFLTYLLSTTSKDIPMNQKSLDKGNGISYIDFIMSGGEVFPKDLYPVRKTKFGKIKFYPKYQIL